jgi:exosortase J
MGSDTRILPDGQGAALAATETGRDSLLRWIGSAPVGIRPHLWAGIGLLMLIGFLGVSPEFASLWGIWTSDPLRSIGMFILPIGIVLILRVWRDQGWEMCGSWWGVLPIVLSFAPTISSQDLTFFWTTHGVRINFIPSVVPIVLYAGGAILLFAGLRVMRRAWFPLLLLLCLQPVPEVVVRFFDLPMQGISAHIARSFASLLGLSPTNGELLRLMFTPSFGMFIAPGCDGMRGAVTLGYGALIVGYLKRMRLLKWGACVAAAVGLGHLFNLLRLCALVLYYKVALGHPALENEAKQADYLIGGLLFLVAALLFLWIVLRARSEGDRTLVPEDALARSQTAPKAPVYWKAGIFALLVLTIIESGLKATRKNPQSLVWEIQRGMVSVESLSDRIPAQVGSYKRVRVWQEDIDGAPVLENAAFEAAPSHEVTVGIWLPPSYHSVRASFWVHGETPKVKRRAEYVTAGRRMVPFSTVLYDDGITVSLAGDTYCSPSECEISLNKGAQGLHFAVTTDHSTRGRRAVPMFFKIQEPHTDASEEATYTELSAECKKFLSNVDFVQLSREFQ